MKLDIIKQLRNSPEKKKLLTIQEAAALCGMKDSVISEAVENGDIRVFSYFSRINIKISMAALDEFIERFSYYKQERKVI